MNIQTRNDLIDAYYDAVDDEAYDRMLAVFVEDLDYRYPGEEPIIGHDALETFFREQRETRNTTHEVFRRIHGTDATACEGTITGEVDDGPFEGRYVGIFEFDDDAKKIASVGVYTQF